MCYLYYLHPFLHSLVWTHQLTQATGNACKETNMNLIQQPVLIASTAADNSVGMGVLLVMFAIIIAGVALRSLSKRARGQWMTFGLRRNLAADYRPEDRAAACTGCPAD
jgi:hypothetical protein